MKKQFLTLVFGLALAQPMLAGTPLPVKLVNNSEFADNEIYVAIIGRNNNHTIYYDFSNNSSDHVAMPELNESANTLTKDGYGWGFADVFTRLDQIADKTIYLDASSSCRLFFSFKSPMYLHAFADGYAGADFGNPTDPNHGIRWELIEYTYGEDTNIWINTTRVDAYQYPMGLELFGSENSWEKYIKRGELMTHEDIIARWKSQHGTDKYAACLKDDITSDDLGPVIVQPSKVAELKNSGFMDDFINQVWSYFHDHDMYVSMGVLGKWKGRVRDDGSFLLTCQEGNYFGVGALATIPRKPTTTDAVEGAGAFATTEAGTKGDLAVQAMFCGAFNRGVVQLTEGLQDWSPEGSDYFNMGTPCNEYVKFFHQLDLTHDGYTYAFAYDDTFDQSSTCHTYAPESITVTIGGFVDRNKEPEETNGISSLTAASAASNDYFTLQGVNAGSHPSAGIYIHNGKKVVVR